MMVMKGRRAAGGAAVGYFGSGLSKRKEVVIVGRNEGCASRCKFLPCNRSFLYRRNFRVCAYDKDNDEVGAFNFDDLDVFQQGEKEDETDDMERYENETYMRESEYSDAFDSRLELAAKWLKERGTFRNAYRHHSNVEEDSNGRDRGGRKRINSGNNVKRVGVGEQLPLLRTSCPAVPLTSSNRAVVEAMNINLKEDIKALREFRLAKSISVSWDDGTASVVNDVGEKYQLKLPSDGYYNDNNYINCRNLSVLEDQNASDEETVSQLREEAVRSILELARNGPEAFQGDSGDDDGDSDIRYIRAIYDIVSEAEDYGILDDQRMHHGITIAYITVNDVVGAVHAIRDAELLGVTPLGETYTLLIRTFAKNGAVEDAEAVLGAMENAGYNPRGAWCVMTMTLAEINMLEDFVRNFEHGLRLGYKPMIDMWESYLRYFLDIGEVDKAAELAHGSLLDNGVGRQAKFDNMVLRGYVNRMTVDGNKDIVAARNWMELHMFDGYNPTKPNIETFNILLEGTVISPVPDEDPLVRCGIVLKQMESFNILPDAATWIYMILYVGKNCVNSYNWCSSFYNGFREAYNRSADDFQKGEFIENQLILQSLRDDKGPNEILLKYDGAFRCFFESIAAMSDFKLMHRFICDCSKDKIIIPQELFTPSAEGPMSAAVLTAPFVSGVGSMVSSPGLLWYSIMISYPRKMDNEKSAPREELKSKTRKFVFNNVSQLFPRNIKETIKSTEGPSRAKALNLNKMKVDEIRAELSDAGLETWGTRPLLVERLKAHLESLKSGSISVEAVRSKARKDMEARKKGLEPAADFNLFMGNDGLVFLSGSESWGSRGQESVINVAGTVLPLSELVAGSFASSNNSTLKIKMMARSEMKMYLQLLDMCADIGVRASPLDFSVMLQVSCGLADISSTIAVLLHFRSYDIFDGAIFRRIKSPLRYLVEHCFNSQERSTTVEDGLIVLEAMTKVGIRPDEDLLSIAKLFQGKESIDANS